MAFLERTLRVICASCVFSIGAQAQYLLNPPNHGAQYQIGDDFQFPAASGVFLGGRTPVNGGTMGGGSMTGFTPDGPGRAFWPPLLVERNPASMGSSSHQATAPAFRVRRWS